MSCKRRTELKAEIMISIRFNKTKQDFSVETQPWPMGLKILRKILKNKASCMFHSA